MIKELKDFFTYRKLSKRFCVYQYQQGCSAFGISSVKNLIGVYKSFNYAQNIAKEYEKEDRIYKYIVEDCIWEE